MAKKRKRKRARRKNPGHKRTTHRRRKRRANPTAHAAPKRRRRRGHRRNPGRSRKAHRRPRRRNPESVAKDLAIAAGVGLVSAVAALAGTSLVAQKLIPAGATADVATQKARIAQGIITIAALGGGFLVATKLKKPAIGAAIAAGGVAGPFVTELGIKAVAALQPKPAAAPAQQPTTNGVGTLEMGSIGYRQPQLEGVGVADGFGGPPA